ncbi:MAG TPA: ABC transporter permease [Nitriliruptoraceae bacterium]|nr:ABC transporter permease [Nitriliruptoraceae bacterium]
MSSDMQPTLDDERVDPGERLTGEESLRDRLIMAVTGPNVTVTILAFVMAFVVGAVLIAFSDEASREALGYVTSRPSDFFTAAWDAITGAYGALISGALGSGTGITESLLAATPLILAGLAVALPFRAGLFNIGGEGQVIAGGMFAAYVGFNFPGLPLVVHLPLAVAAGFVGGAIMGFIPGILKVRTGAHEVIVTIMLNNIAIVLLDWTLTLPTFIGNATLSPKWLPIADSADLPTMFGSRLNIGIFMALVAAVVIHVFMERSARGFEIEAVGLNPTAATTAGMSVGRATIWALTLAGGLAGLAGSVQTLGVSDGGVTAGFSGGLGFDGITVALLGRSRVPGTVMAGLLFGALEVGGRAMQAEAGINLDLVGVLQALIILFVAAPALVRWLFRLDRPSRRAKAKEVTA